MTDVPLRRRLGMAFGIVALLAIVAGLVAVPAYVRLDRSSDQLSVDLFQAYARSADLRRAALDQETGVRGFVITGEEPFLEPYDSGLASERTAIDLLREGLAEQPQLLAEVDSLEAEIEDWRTTYAEPFIARVRAGGVGAVGQGDLAQEKAAFDGIRAAFVDYSEQIVAARDEALADNVAAQRVLGLILLASALGVVLSGVALWVVLRRWVTEPLAHLGAKVQAVAGGELSRSINVEGPPEVTALAFQIDDMRRQIVEEYAAAHTARLAAQAATEALEEQARDLRRSNMELEQFAYVASHDLQEPLRKVASFCQMLERRYSGQLDERGEQYIAFAVDGAKRMQRLINDLLAFSRVGRTGISSGPVDLEVAFDQAVRNVEAAIEASDAEVTHDPLPTVAGELGLLVQVFQNLIGNAVKFRGEDPPRVHVGCVEVDGAYELCVADNGIGIQAQYAERIFVIFQRLHAKDAYEGTGIGLSLCKKIVEHHGGSIWLDTTVPSGTTFRVRLPVPVFDDPEQDLAQDLTQVPAMAAAQTVPATAPERNPTS